jgi:cell division protein FtsQ
VAAKARTQRPPAQARVVAVPRPQGRQRRVAQPLARLAVSRRSLAAGIGILALVAGGYVLARETSLFGVRNVAVSGGSPVVDAQVRHALEPMLGRSLVGLDGDSLLRRVEALPTVVSATYDRAFPHTLRVTVVAERPVAVLRAGTGAWLVSARGRVMARLQPDAKRGLPRIWLPAHTPVGLGAELPASGGGTEARALGLSGAFVSRVGSVSDGGGALVFHLKSGLELELGAASGIHLKLAVARRALRALPPGTGYLDVSVPGRPVGAAQPPSATDSGNGKVSTRGRG